MAGAIASNLPIFMEHSYGNIEIKTLSEKQVILALLLFFTGLSTASYFYFPEFFILTLAIPTLIIFTAIIVMAGVVFKWPGFKGL